MDADYAKKRLEKDLIELKRMCDDHFKQRKEDEAELGALRERIAKRKKMRAEQMAARIEREKVQAEKEQAIKEAKAAEEEAKRKEAEKQKKTMMAKLSNSFKSQGHKLKTSRVDRERKKKALQERRKPINGVDHWGQEKLLEKINELYKHLCKTKAETVQAEMDLQLNLHLEQISRAQVNTVMSNLNKKSQKKRFFIM